jgi:hypothetical protein
LVFAADRKDVAWTLAEVLFPTIKPLDMTPASQTLLLSSPVLRSPIMAKALIITPSSESKKSK